MENKTPYPTEWTCTDPDNLQYGRQIAERMYEFKEFERYYHMTTFSRVKKGEIDVRTLWDNPMFWKQKTIDLDNYSLEQIEDAINSFGYTYDSIYEDYDTDASWIIAECIFEMTY